MKKIRARNFTKGVTECEGFPTFDELFKAADFTGWENLLKDETVGAGGDGHTKAEAVEKEAGTVSEAAALVTKDAESRAGLFDKLKEAGLVPLVALRVLGALKVHAAAA